MPKKQAVCIKSLEHALEINCPIVIMMPNDDKFSLSTVFDEQLDTSNAPMKSLTKWAKPPRQDGKKYAGIETQDWRDFSAKIQQTLQAVGPSKLFIGYEGYLTNFSNACSHPKSFDSLQKELQSGGRGDALYTDHEKTIGFPRIFNAQSAMQVHIPYIDRSSSELQWIRIDEKPVIQPIDNEEEPYHDHFAFVNET